MRINLFIPACKDTIQPGTRTTTLGVAATKDGGAGQ